MEPSNQRYRSGNRLSDRFSSLAADCGSLEELWTHFQNAAGELGFDYVALLHHDSLSRPGDHYIRLDNYPEAWATELREGGLAPYDPVHRASRVASAAFRWRNLGRLTELGERQKTILKRSREFGIGDGMTVPVNVPGEPAGSCSFAVRRGVKLPERQLHAAEIIGLHAFDAARRLSRAGHSRPHLSRRQVQCLRLVAAGKTDFEISLILGISLETARQYIKSARKAYDVVARTQLVALGLRDQWLSFDDATHPRE